MTEYRCLCGHTEKSLQAMNAHRHNCELMRIAYLGDLRRVGNAVKRTPTMLDFSRYHNRSLPAWTTLGMFIFDSWNDFVMEAGFKPTKKRTHETIR